MDDKQRENQESDKVVNGDILFDDLSNLKQIGEGSFGRVYRADYIGTDVAVKECFMNSTASPSDLPSDWNFHKEARHPNIVQFMGLCIEKEKFYIVTEYVGGGNLKEWILHEEELQIDDKVLKMKQQRQAYSFGIDIARALAYLHAHQMIHRDLKLENLLLTENLRVKVCDFGFSRIQQKPSSTSISASSSPNGKHDRKLSYCGTEDYMAPELILCMDYTHSIDIFSYGIVLLSLVMMTSPITRVFQRRIPGFGLDFGVIEDELPSNFPQKEKFLKLLQGCLEEDGDKRLPWKDVLQALKELEIDILTRIKESGGEQFNNIGVPRMLGKGDSDSIHSSSAVDLNKLHLNSSESITDIQQQPQAPNYIHVSGKPSNNVNNIRIGHNVPHRFSIAYSHLTLTTLKCQGCNRGIHGFMTSYLQCDDCGFVSHKKCSKNLVANCGFDVDGFMKMKRQLPLAQSHGSSSMINISTSISGGGSEKLKKSLISLTTPMS